jgi:hypothetical protein
VNTATATPPCPLRQFLTAHLPANPKSPTAKTCRTAVTPLGVDVSGPTGQRGGQRE